MKTVNFIQFLRPDGRQTPVTIELDDSVTEKVAAIEKAGCRFTVEELMNGMVSACIEHEEGDFDCVLCVNGPPVPVKITEMIMRFAPELFEEWLKKMQGDENVEVE